MGQLGGRPVYAKLDQVVKGQPPITRIRRESGTCTVPGVLLSKLGGFLPPYWIGTMMDHVSRFLRISQLDFLPNISA